MRTQKYLITNNTNLKSKNYKKIAVLTSLLILFSCNKLIDNTPKCSEEIVKNEAIKTFNEKIKPDLVTGYVNEEIKEVDLREYAYDNGLNADDVIKTEREKLTQEFDTKADVNLKATKLKHIRTEKEEKEIKKCNCVAEVDNTNLKPIKIYYTAQKTEDEKEGVFVEVTYELKE